MENNKLVVNGIVKFSNVDGPGNRYTIFTQGCNINCFYCHNFETINMCNSCGLCVNFCESKALSLENGKVAFEKSKCVGCDTCIRTCQNSSSPKTQLYTVDELISEIKKYEAFLKGITVSGGECTLQADFMVELFKRIKEETELTCFIDTNGYFDLESESIQKLIEVTDKFMIDIKAITEPEKIISVGESDRNIRNLKYLLDIDKIYEVRTVVTNDFDFFEKVIDETSKIIKAYDVRYKIIKMHHDKLKDIIPDVELMERYRRIVENYNIKCVE